MHDTTFEQIESKIRALKQGSDQRHGRAFEPLIKWWLQNDPVWSSIFEEVWLWEEWPDKWKVQEAGIDHVARGTKGKMWAIQTKMYHQDTNVTKEDIQAFISESEGFDRRLLVTTSWNLSFHAKDLCKRRGVVVVSREDLLMSVVEWPTEWPTTRKAKRLPPCDVESDPRTAVQKVAIAKIAEGLADGGRGKLHMPPGCGKTVTALRAKEKLGVNSTLFMVPTLDLARQTVLAWMRDRSEDKPFRPVAVCSSMAKTTDDGEDIDIGMPVTTDPETLVAECKGDEPVVVFATYSSSDVIAKAHERGLPEFDLLIADEAHRCAGKIGNLFTAAVDGRIRATRRLYMTATARTHSASRIKTAQEQGQALASMDDEELFGPVLYEMSFHEARELNLICRYTLSVVEASDEGRSMVEHRELIKTEAGETDAGTMMAAVALVEAMPKYGMRRVITFHNRVDRARGFSELLNNTGDILGVDIDTRHVDGDTPTTARARIKHWFEKADKPSVVSNVKCWGEGIDVPSLDGVAFVDPKWSRIDIVQAIGRAVRLSEGKEVARIIVPVAVEPGQEPNEALRNSSWKTVWQVMRVLAEKDETFKEMLRNYHLELGQRRPGTWVPLPKCIEFPHWMKLPEFASAFRLMFVGLIQRTLVEWVLKAEQLAKENGGTLQPVSWLQANGYSGLNKAMYANPETFAHISQEVLCAPPRDLKEWVLEAEQLAKENGGTLHSDWWLKTNGYSGLNTAKNKNQEAFAHIPQKQYFKTLEEHVADAEKLAKEHGDSLPGQRWMQLNDRSGLSQVMYKNPEAFAHIPQDWEGGKRLKEHIADAERLAKENGDVLPKKAELDENLVQAIRKHPAKFAHIQQDKHQWKTLDDLVKLAEQLAKENNGQLPAPSRMTSPELRSVQAAIYDNPEAFAHIERDRVRDEYKTVEEHVANAGRLAEENGGEIPNSKWLTSNGHQGLKIAMRNNPEKFAHLAQKKVRFIAKEYITEAEQLAAENGGKIQNANWLFKNGRAKLARFMSKKKTRDLFAHIPQEHSGRNTKEENRALAKKLAKENGGILPGVKWLTDNGHNSLYQYIHKYKDNFADIPQEGHSRLS